MEKKKIIIATGIFGLTYGFVANYEQLRGTENLTIIDQTVIEHMDSSLAVLLALFITIIYLAFVYKRNKKSEFELLQDYIDCSANENVKNELQIMSDVDRQCYYRILQSMFSEGDQQAYKDFVDNYNLTYRKVRLICRGVIAVCFALIMIATTPLKNDYVKACELYNQQLEQEEAARLAAEAEYNQIIEDQILYYDGLPPINLVSGNTFKKGDVETYINEYIRTQPQFLLNRCGMINLCTHDTFIQYCNAYNMTTSLGEYGNTYAFAHSSNMNIFLQLNIDGEDDRTWQYHTVAHELSHIFDFSYGNSYTWRGISDGATWQNLYSQYGSLISDYSNYSSSEGFADAAAMYVEHPEDLKQISSEVFNYINSLYQMY